MISIFDNYHYLFMQTKIKQRNAGDIYGHKPNGSSRYLQNISPKHNRKCASFSASHGTFSKIDHIVRHQASLNRYKKIKITPCILSDYYLLELNFRNNRKPTHSWKLNNSLFNDNLVREEIKKGIKNFL